MADQGKLSKEDREKAVSWVSGHWKGDPSCPVCKVAKWTVAEHLTQSLLYTGHGTVLGGPTYPVVQFICTNCGYAISFNAVLMGIVAPAQADPVDSKDKTGAGHD